MSDLGWMRIRWAGRAGAAEAPWAWQLKDPYVLYCRTKAAEAQAEEWGFEGTAAALAAIAAAMIRAPGAERGPSGRAEDAPTRH